jgi:hypothetical protein
MPGLFSVSTETRVTRLSEDSTVGAVDIQFSAQTEPQRFIFALTAKEAGDKLAASEFFQIPTSAKFSWRVDPYYVWVASETSAGKVLYRYE